MQQAETGFIDKLNQKRKKWHRVKAKKKNEKKKERRKTTQNIYLCVYLMERGLQANLRLYLERWKRASTSGIKYLLHFLFFFLLRPSFSRSFVLHFLSVFAVNLFPLGEGHSSLTRLASYAHVLWPSTVDQEEVKRAVRWAALLPEPFRLV